MFAIFGYGNVAGIGEGTPNIDFAANAASLGSLSKKVAHIPELAAALQRARSANRNYLICIDKR